MFFVRWGGGIACEDQIQNGQLQGCMGYFLPGSGPKGQFSFQGVPRRQDSGMWAAQGQDIVAPLIACGDLNEEMLQAVIIGIADGKGSDHRQGGSRTIGPIPVHHHGRGFIVGLCKGVPHPQKEEEKRPWTQDSPPFPYCHTVRYPLQKPTKYNNRSDLAKKKCAWPPNPVEIPRIPLALSLSESLLPNDTGPILCKDQGQTTLGPFPRSLC